MAFVLDYNSDDKILFNDNIAVYQTKDQMHFFHVFITDEGASIGRYCVPGRLDIYSFDFLRGSCGIGARIAYFTDLRSNPSLSRAVKQAKRDLKKKQVKELLKAAKLKCPRSYLDPLLEFLR